MKKFIWWVLSFCFFCCNNEKPIENIEHKENTISLNNIPDSAFSNSLHFQEVDKNILLGKFDYKEDTNFSIVNPKYSSKTIYLRKEVLIKFDEMYNAAHKDGIKLTVISGTRSFYHQKSIWERKWDKNIKNMDSLSTVKEILKYSSMPSTSRHHWGTDIDLNDLENSYFESGEGKKVFEWLIEHAHKYGFHMTYDNQDESKRTGYKMEKWHWSYMPIAEQYLKQYKETIKCEDISSFKGSQFACHEEINVIKNFVMGINNDYKKIINATK
ncbi:MAG: D-alanyl-D-alanine carboxypeptidase [Crocinitomicaceae bacterium]|nr:D-alanyl-D-alanine carboxypeptidase [Crocinitomicaceae bacterium]|tara:strand:- start:7319 stop:8128 length:810 start_codon:yes stop_codon:yes gene_type:complete